MRWLIVFLLFTNSLLGQFTYSGYLYNANGSGANNVPVKLYKSTAGATTKSGTLVKITSGIPSDRGRGSSILHSTANTDEKSIAITFPSGFSPSYAGISYSSGHVNANSWFCFGTSSSSGYNGNATSPNQPTIHIGSVDNGSTDNNVSFVSTESYTDGTYGDVFRVRYEGNCKYNQTGVNYTWDLYFIKNQSAKQIVVWRTFTADGSNQEVMGISTGSAWMASTLVTAGTFSSTSWEINTTSTTTTSSNILDATAYTNSSGYYSFSRTTVAGNQFTIQVDAPTRIQAYTTSDIQAVANIILNKTTKNGLSFHMFDVNDDTKLTVADKYYVAARKAGIFSKWRIAPDVRIFTTAQYNSIVASTTNVRATYPGVTTHTTSTLTSGGTLNLYIIAPGYAGSVIY
jgi:hypothetical protein